jgi:hypothetical protein
MAGKCYIDRDSIRQGIKDEVAKSLDTSQLFNRVNPPGSPIDLEDIKKYAQEIPSDIFRQGFLANPEDFLREIAKQSASSESERQGALNVAGQNLFGISQQYNLFSPKDVNSPYQDIINSLNSQYGEEVVKSTDENPLVYSVSPSESLVDQYEGSFEKRDYQFDDSPVIIDGLDYNTILHEAGLTETSTPQDFMHEYMQEYSQVLSNARKANPRYTIKFTDEDISHFSVRKNEVVISLPEIYNTSQKTNIPFKQAISITILHELGHAATYYSVPNITSNSELYTFFFAALKHHNETSSFEDTFRQGYTKNDLPYAFKNVQEFIAETYGNPYFRIG